MAKDTKHVIIKNLNEYQKSLVLQAMQVTGNKTASRAILQVLSEYMDIRKQLFELKEKSYNQPEQTASALKEQPQAVKRVINTQEDELPLLKGVDRLTNEDFETLKHIREHKTDGITCQDLAELSQKSDRTIRHRIKRLKDENLIRVKNDGNLRIYYPV